MGIGRNEAAGVILCGVDVMMIVYNRDIEM